MPDCNRGLLSCQIESMRQVWEQSSGLPFSDVLSAEDVAVALGDTSEPSEPVYTPATTLWMFLSQVLDADHSCRQAVARLASWLALRGAPACSPRTGGYCKARQRLPETGLHCLMHQAGRQLQQRAAASWLWKGRTVKIVDGTTVWLPDTPANQTEYPQPDGQKPGLGFPIVRLVVLIGLATGAVLEAALGRYCGKGTGELSLFRQIWDELQAGDVLLGDRLFCSYFEVAVLTARGVDVIVPRHQSRRTDFRTGTRLGRRDHVIGWSKPKACPDWLDKETYRSLPEMLILRELEVRIEQRGFRVRKLIVVTTLLDPEAFGREELAGLYRQRWQAELDVRSIKQALQMEQLRCKSPEMIRKELWVHLLAYNLIRTVMAQAAERHEALPRQISFTGAVQTLNAFDFSLRTATPRLQSEIYQRLLSAIAAHRVGNRPDRVEPRALKRRKKNYPLLTQARQQARKRLAA